MEVKYKERRGRGSKKAGRSVVQGMLASLILLLLVTGSWQSSQSRRPRSFRGLPTVKEMVAAAGYQSIDIEVITEDGYSLWMHRLGNNTGPPVMIQHGVFVASECWITRGPQKDLAFFLLEEGYDVWLTNQRGTVYNDYNLKYKRSDPRFWNFSFHEAGLYDLSAFIDKILQIRGTKQLFYIGHSLGTVTFLLMASLRPEYNSKIMAAVLLSPVAFPPSPNDTKPFLKFLLPIADPLYKLNQKLGIYQVLPRTQSYIRFLKNFCGYKSKTQSWCLYLTGLYLGEHGSNIDRKDFGFHMPYFSGGTSSKTLEHITQIYQTETHVEEKDYNQLNYLFNDFPIKWIEAKRESRYGIARRGYLIGIKNWNNLADKLKCITCNNQWLVEGALNGSNFYFSPAYLCEFKLFDYGRNGNLDIYGAEKPPFYDIDSVTAPVALFWSYNDPLLTEESVNKLASRLPHLLFSKPVTDPQFTHLDMYLGKNAYQVLYPDVINLLKLLKH